MHTKPTFRPGQKSRSRQRDKGQFSSFLKATKFRVLKRKTYSFVWYVL
jgi:hypothetical protein